MNSNISDFIKSRLAAIDILLGCCRQIHCECDSLPWWAVIRWFKFLGASAICLGIIEDLLVQSKIALGLWED